MTNLDITDIDRAILTDIDRAIFDGVRDDIERIIEADKMRRATERASQVLRKQGGPHEPIKEQLREARKEKMRTVQHFLCDRCDITIVNPENGFVIHGNIYTANPDAPSGVIGNNFPGDPEERVSAVRKTVLCRKCFLEAIESVKSPPHSTGRGSREIGAQNPSWPYLSP